VASIVSFAPAAAQLKLGGLIGRRRRWVSVRSVNGYDPIRGVGVPSSQLFKGRRKDGGAWQTIRVEGPGAISWCRRRGAVLELEENEGFDLYWCRERYIGVGRGWLSKVGMDGFGSRSYNRVG
jgi:hypothetical protein